MKKPKKESLFHGAAALAVAGIIVKVIGAFYKIPLGSMLGPVGMANFSIAYNIYSLLFVLATAGVPIAVSKMVAEAYAEGNAIQADEIFTVSRTLFSAVGFFGFLILFAFAGPISRIMGSADAAYAVKAIAPSVLFVSLSAVSRGYFQGGGDMYPTAVSEISEAIGKLSFGILSAFILKRRGAPLPLISAGAVSGVAAGSFLSCLYFSFLKKHEKKQKSFFSMDIAVRLLSISVPIMLASAIMSLSAVVDSALVLNLLAKTGKDTEGAKWLFGTYNYSTTLFSLPTAIFSTLASALVPALAGAKTERCSPKTDKLSNSGVRLSVLAGALSAFGMAALADGIITLLYGRGVDENCIRLSSELLKVLCIGIVPLAIVTATNAVHQAMGRAKITVISIASGGIVKIISNCILVPIPKINIYGAAISTVLCYVAAMAVNLAALKKYDTISIDFTRAILCPILNGAAVFVSARAVYFRFFEALGTEGATVLAILCGALVGMLLIFLLKNITEYDKKLLFGRKKIFKFIENS